MISLIRSSRVFGTITRSKTGIKHARKIGFTNRRFLPSHVLVSTSIPISTRLSHHVQKHRSVVSCISRSLATGAAERTSKSISEDTSLEFISGALKSMFWKDNKVNKTELRNALRMLKELEASKAAKILAQLSEAPKPDESAAKVVETLETMNLKPSPMGSILEESLARLLEVGFHTSNLPKIFSVLSEILPQWRVLGWDNVIRRYVANKSYEPDSIAQILTALPRDQILNFSIRTTPNDLIFKYQQRWMSHPKAVSQLWGTDGSPRCPPSFYAAILSKTSQHLPSWSDVGHIVAKIAFQSWKLETPLGSNTPYEAFTSSIYFAALVLASIVEHSLPLTNAEISELLHSFNSKMLDHLRANPDLVKQGFNTYEYLEWMTFLVAESSRRRKSKFNDIWLIKKCLDVMLDKWSSEHTAVVSAAIANRFSILQWIREGIKEYRTGAS